MSMILASPALQTALAAGMSRSVGSFFRVVVDQKEGINAAPQSVMVKREGIMLGLTTGLSYATQLLFKTPLGANLLKLPLGRKAEPLLRVLAALPGMLAAEVLSRKIAYQNHKNDLVKTQALPSATAANPFQTIQTMAHNPFAVGAMAVAAPMVLNAVTPTEFGGYPAALRPSTPFAFAARPLYY